MPKIIIPRDGGAGNLALSTNYNPLAIAIKMMMKLEKQGVSSRLSLEDAQNIILYTGADA